MGALVTVDGYNLALEQGTGVATYARNLTFRLGALGADVAVLYGKRSSMGSDPLLREITFFDAERPLPKPLPRALRDMRRLLLATGGVRAVEVPVTGQVITDSMAHALPNARHIWNLSDLYRLAINHFKWTGRRLRVRLPGDPALVHWTYPLPIMVPGALNIYTMHDLVPLRLPYTTLDNKRHYYRVARMLAQQADHIVTVSECSARDIISLLGADPARVTNTYQSVEVPAEIAAAPEASVRQDLRAAFGLDPDSYFLFFGAIEPKKNVDRIIEAFLASGSNRRLVIVGKDGWGSTPDGRRAARLLPEAKGDWLSGYSDQVQGRILRMDYAPFRLLISLIRGARAVLFPSLYEGFGLPALEAMQLGTPVLTSTAASLPEIVGQAALTVDPYDVRDIANGIIALDTDAALCGALSDAGPRQAALFGAKPYEARLADLYGRLGVNLGG
ncbi:glycosyltransferase involved in cell wall biosynthesis [Humitalea rosea]|uniref:Glycosyltransferase involved in cell wall biosynthesis n=1 Tax=Humitalea rosea TaxID=990373 RepID=A0A2W7I5D9_9PROT|nr:glycosyltransferase family 1 protein [Humitalea rosea]PZW41894.1 glycosyltransferase involved in cell wall biosynthesis [Humitalea rosea]